MRDKILLLVLLIVIVFIGWWFFPKSNVSPKITPPAILSQKCGIENCHGLLIKCGANIPDACTFEYRIGDNCRQFASCKKTNNQCKLETTKEFNRCKACVEDCVSQYKENPVDAFTCEGKCLESILPP